MKSRRRIKLASDEARNLAHRRTTWAPVHRSEIRLPMSVRVNCTHYRVAPLLSASVLLPPSKFKLLDCQTYPRGPFEPQRLFRALSNRVMA
jgi:hypothetical protein